MFSVVIPTFWSYEVTKFDFLVQRLSSSSYISEIIIINNAPHTHSHRYYNNPKVKELVYQNIYLYQSWNIGTYQSKNELVCLMSDNLEFNLDILSYVESEMKREEVHIIGTSKECFNLKNESEYTLSKVEMRNKYWSTLIFVKKDKYIWIPDDFKIYFGDDYLVKEFQGFVWKINGLKINILDSLFNNMNINDIVNSDTNNSYKYNLPLSYDY